MVKVFWCFFLYRPCQSPVSLGEWNSIRLAGQPVLHSFKDQLKGTMRDGPLPSPSGRLEDGQPVPAAPSLCARPTRVCVLITTTKPGRRRLFAELRFQLRTSRGQKTSKWARGRRRRLGPGFISRESSILRTRCQHSRTVYGIRIPRGAHPRLRVLAAIIYRLPWRGGPEHDCPRRTLGVGVGWGHTTVPDPVIWFSRVCCGFRGNSIWVT
ncbi:uncharacterized protein LOC113901589 [Bos indicus x Bos taurus]|uniref:uncharacterized protein LOC113901589 n=1 Tax=Bos indicus x Bos taurus TaxID=30522 RepID=UPI000F7D1801|nr:uncharacterized protein LOC113901589 [Bos indicus x Bos taurus]